MIRTALTLSISSQDAQTTSYLVNGTHLGLLSAAPQNTHVQTTHRPLQLIVALKDQELGTGSSLVIQRQQLSAWQGFLTILSRRPGSDLNKLLLQYHLFPNWLIVFDEHRLQAWLPADSGFYLLRSQELRRMRPTAPRDELPAAADYPDGPRQYYSLGIQQNDQFFLLPPALFNLYSTGEAADILSGLRQLPAKVGELIATARLRGYSEEFTWLAMQVMRLEEDSLPGGIKNSDSKPGKTTFASLFNQSRQSGTADPDSESVDLAATDDDSQAGAVRPSLWSTLNSRWFPYLLGGGLLLIVALVIVIIMLSLPNNIPAPSDTTVISTNQTTVVPTVTAKPTLTPTEAPSPTPALPQLLVSARRLNLRSEPTRNSTLLDTMETGDILYQLAEPADNWVKVRTADGLEGFVYYSYVTPSDNN